MTQFDDVSFHAFDLKTGRRLQRLEVASMPTIGRLIGEPTSTQVDCRYWRNGGPVVGFKEATLPGRTMIVALDGDSERPIWGAMNLRRRNDDAEKPDVATLDVATLEAYFDRRFVKDHTYSATAQGAIISGILAADLIPTGIDFVVDSVSSFPRDRTYLDDDDKTVYAVLEELMDVEGGPEFTVDLEWLDAEHTTLKRIIRVRDRIGTAQTDPVARFEQPGSVNSAEYIEDFSAENGANDILAVSSGEGDLRPESKHAVAQELLNNGWPRYEHRFTPSTSIINTSVLDAHARATLKSMKLGLNQLTLSATFDGPRLGVDYSLGDDVSAVLTSHWFPEAIDADGNLGPGYRQVVRCIGWDLDLEARVQKPILWEAS